MDDAILIVSPAETFTVRGLEMKLNEMPITSGPQVLEMIRSEASTAGIPVMFLTGKNDKQSIMKVLELKPVDYLLKTIDKQSLRDKLEVYFKSLIYHT